MIDHPDSLRLPVGVVVERRPATSPWADWVWKPAAVLLDLPEVPPWTLLREEGGGVVLRRGDGHHPFPDRHRQLPPRPAADAAAPVGGAAA